MSCSRPYLSWADNRQGFMGKLRIVNDSIFSSAEHFWTSVLIVPVTMSETGNRDEQVSSCPQGAPWMVGWSKSAQCASALTKGCMYKVLWEHKKEVTNSAVGHRESLKRSWDIRVGPQRHSLSQHEPDSNFGDNVFPQEKSWCWAPCLASQVFFPRHL